MNFGHQTFSSYITVWGYLVSYESQLRTNLQGVSLALPNFNNRLPCLRSEPLRGHYLAMYSTRSRRNLLLPANVRTNSTKRRHLCPPKTAILEAG